MTCLLNAFSRPFYGLTSHGKVTFSDGASMSSAETYPKIAEAISGAALKLLGMPERLEALDPLQTSTKP